MGNKWKLPCYIAFYPLHLITGTKANLTRWLRITDGRSKDATLLRGASAENEGIQEIPATTIGGFPKLGVPFRGVPIIRIKVFWGLYWSPPKTMLQHSTTTIVTMIVHTCDTACMAPAKDDTHRSSQA